MDDGRFLTNEEEVWDRNAWDHVPPPSDHEEAIRASLERQKRCPVAEGEKGRYNERPARHWCAPPPFFFFVMCAEWV